MNSPPPRRLNLLQDPPDIVGRLYLSRVGELPTPDSPTSPNDRHPEQEHLFLPRLQLKFLVATKPPLDPQPSEVSSLETLDLILSRHACGTSDITKPVMWSTIGLDPDRV